MQTRSPNATVPPSSSGGRGPVGALPARRVDVNIASLDVHQGLDLSGRPLAELPDLRRGLAPALASQCEILRLEPIQGMYDDGM
eukprot:4123388-Prymnesium_polylepis.1